MFNRSKPATTMQAKRHLLSELIDKTELQAYKEFFLKHLRPCVYLIPTTPRHAVPERYNDKKMVECHTLVPETTLPVGSSRLGGKPDLPAAFIWPEHEFGPYRFLGQINMKEVRAACVRECANASETDIHSVFDAWLPPPPTTTPIAAAASASPTDSDDGLLSFFFADDAEERVFWRELDFIKVFYFSLADATLALRASVPKLGHVDTFTEAGCLPVRAEAHWMLPSGRSEYPHGEWPLTKEEDDSYEYQGNIVEACGPDADHTAGFLFGYPRYSTLGYDPTPDPHALVEPERKRVKAETACDAPEPSPPLSSSSAKRYVPLLNMPSYYDELGWCWMDGDRLMVFVDADDLARGDFTTVLAEAG